MQREINYRNLFKVLIIVDVKKTNPCPNLFKLKLPKRQEKKTLRTYSQNNHNFMKIKSTSE